MGTAWLVLYIRVAGHVAKGEGGQGEHSLTQHGHCVPAATANLHAPGAFMRTLDHAGVRLS